jgi:hypothetical protein
MTTITVYVAILIVPIVEHIVSMADKPVTQSTADQLVELFKNIKNGTAKEDLLWHIKMAMLVQVAKREG